MMQEREGIIVSEHTWVSFIQLKSLEIVGSPETMFWVDQNFDTGDNFKDPELMPRSRSFHYIR